MSADASTSPSPGMVSTAVHRIVPVVEQQCLARDTYRLRLQCPEIARQILPGQFFMIRVPHTNDPLLGRAFALFDVYDDEEGQPAGVDFGYVAIGKLTTLMTGWKPGDAVEIWGPLGNGFPPVEGRLLIVAGGIGQTPFLAVIREALGLRRYGHPQRSAVWIDGDITMAYGVRTADLLAGVEQFSLDGVTLQLATDDGSRGHHGFVTDLLRDALESAHPPDRVYCCGPEPMMRATAAICRKFDAPCWLSLETPMACGFGACFSCVTRVLQEDGGWDYRRTCVEGPVFRADQLVL